MVSVVDVCMSICMNMNMCMYMCIYMYMHSRRMQGCDRQEEIVAGWGEHYPERKF